MRRIESDKALRSKHYGGFSTRWPRIRGITGCVAGARAKIRGRAGRLFPDLPTDTAWASGASDQRFNTDRETYAPLSYALPVGVTARTWFARADSITGQRVT
jgi:hypothetical protein